MTSGVFNNIQPKVPYTAPVQAPSVKTEVKEALPASNVAQADSVEISNKQEKPKKKGLIAGTKEFIANVKKFFATSGTYIKGTVKGIASGAAIGSIIYTAGNIANHFIGKHEGKKLIHNKVLAVIAGGLALAGNLWTASLDATEHKSDIDHRYIGHKQ